MKRKAYMRPSMTVFTDCVSEMICMSLDPDNPTSGIGGNTPGYGGETGDGGIDAGGKLRGDNMFGGSSSFSTKW